MKIINNGIIKDYYHLVVIGAGIGGITARTLLANRGLSVLVVEQHYIPGGVCSAVKCKGIAMDAGGDIVRGAGTVVAAIADGRRAAIAINEQLNSDFRN